MTDRDELREMQRQTKALQDISKAINELTKTLAKSMAKFSNAISENFPDGGDTPEILPETVHKARESVYGYVPLCNSTSGSMNIEGRFVTCRLCRTHSEFKP